MVTRKTAPLPEAISEEDGVFVVPGIFAHTTRFVDRTSTAAANTDTDRDLMHAGCIRADLNTDTVDGVPMQRVPIGLGEIEWPKIKRASASADNQRKCRHASEYPEQPEFLENLLLCHVVVSPVEHANAVVAASSG